MADSIFMKAEAHSDGDLRLYYVRGVDRAAAGPFKRVPDAYGDQQGGCYSHVCGRPSGKCNAGPVHRPCDAHIRQALP